MDTGDPSGESGGPTPLALSNSGPTLQNLDPEDFGKFIRSALALLGLLGTAADTFGRATGVISGRVLYGPSRKPLAGAWAVLHRVHNAGGKRPVDSTRTGPQGEYLSGSPPPTRPRCTS